MYDDLTQRLHRYTENCVAYKLDADFASAVREAADAIEQLQDDNKALIADYGCLEGLFKMSKPQWIPVTERLPEKGMRVLCACRANIFCVLKWDGIDWVENPSHVYMSGFVTHWMPLPEPPEKESES